MTEDQVKFEIDFRKEIVKVLLSAFPERDHLAAMVEDEIYKELNTITYNEPDYETAVRNLVKWAKTEGCLCALVIGASRKKSGNSKLKNFVGENLQTLLEFDFDSRLLSHELWTSLIERLRSIVEFEQVVLLALNQTLPDMDNNHPKLIKDLSRLDLSNDVKWLITLAFFLKYYSVQDATNGQHYIVSFIQHLQELASSTVAYKETLYAWLNSLPIELKPQYKHTTLPFSEEKPDDKALKNVQASFLISVEYPDETSAAQPDEFTINTYLIMRLGDREQDTKFQQVPLRIVSDETSVQANEPILAQTNTIGTVEDIERSLPEWVKTVENLVGDLCVDLKSNYRLNFLPTYDLTLEFWLPFEKMLAAVDTWGVYKQAHRWQRQSLIEKQPIGKRHRILVRSHDRFIDSYYLDKLIRTCQDLSNFLKDPINKTKIREKLEHIDCQKSLNAISKELKTKHYLGLTLACSFLGKQNQTQELQYNKLFEAVFDVIFEGGIPLILWSRDPNLPDPRRKMEALLTIDNVWGIDNFCGFNKLLERIKQEREFPNDGKSLGNNLSIWCDEPQRLVELKEFRRNGRLSA